MPDAHRPHLVFAGGGTGGHLFPGIAVADRVAELRPDARITFLTSGRPLDAELLRPHPAWQRIAQPVRPFRTAPWHWPGFLLDWRSSVRRAQSFLKSEKVSAVLGLGGYAAGPAVVAARRVGIRAGILNPDATPGRANRYLSKFADLAVTQWPETRFDAAERGGRLRVENWGCPIRREFERPPTPQAARASFGLAPERPVLLVTGASQGARTINQAIGRVWLKLLREFPDWQLLHLAGTDGFEPAEQALSSLRGADRARTVVRAFCDDMPAALSAARLVVSRAGASTLAELAAIGRDAILLPYPFDRGEHQRANANSFVAQSGGVVLTDHRDVDQNAEQLDRELRSAMRGGSRERERESARPGGVAASMRVAQWLLAE